jgi:hypothetical protein
VNGNDILPTTAASGAAGWQPAGMADNAGESIVRRDSMDSLRVRSSIAETSG